MGQLALDGIEDDAAESSRQGVQMVLGFGGIVDAVAQDGLLNDPG